MGNHKVLKTAGVNSRYSMYDFIGAVRAKSILWDREHVDFHSREMRDKAWHEIGRQLCKNYDAANEQERNEIAKTLLKRWKNTRDSFLRVFRVRQSGKSMTRPSYIYEKEMSFLVDAKEDTKILINSGQQDIRKYETPSIGSSPETKPVIKRKLRGCGAVTMPKSRAKQRHLSEANLEFNVSATATHANDDNVALDIDNDGDDNDDDSIGEHMHNFTNNVLNDLNIAKESPIANNTDSLPSSPKKFDPALGALLETQASINTSMNNNSTIAVVANDPDQAFFETIKPYMQKMNDDQKLDFQIDVLRLLRNFKAK